MKNVLIIDYYGHKRWYIDDKRHRVDGPAVEFVNGDKLWYKEDLLHREDGPAIELENGVKAWYYQGQKIECSSQQEFEKLIRLKLFW